MFAPSLIEREDVAFIHQVDHGRSVAGLAANLSDDVVGISNLFGERTALNACIEAARRFAGGRAVVGYGDREELAGLEPLGFAALGPVRIWIRR